jgi:serine/threonine-protein kinase HipA
MTSKLPHPRDAFVWTWLPGAIEPVVAGRLVRIEDELQFVYGRGYRERPDAIPLYLPELPLTAGAIRPPLGLTLASAIRDAAPDAWGRRVILNRTFGIKRDELNGLEVDELVFLLESGSDRVGALDFQHSAERYTARGTAQASLEELLASADRVERNLPLNPELDQALHHGSSIGGARPKALLTDHGERCKYVAKFSSSNDTYSVVKGEYIAMRLAALAGLNVAPVKLRYAAGKDVLLVERFDRVASDGGWARRSMVSALTMLELDEMQARYASYQDLAEVIRMRFTKPKETLRELFSRLVFNILVGNLDDHARNHAAFWDGSALTLTPAYDICPQPRAGGEASQAMLIHDQVRSSQVAACLAAAGQFHLGEDEAIAITEQQIRTIGEHWRELVEEAALGPIDRTLFWSRQFLNAFAFYGLEGKAGFLADLAAEVRATRN